jgi:DNA-binding CsgD family transcriptional regulator
MNKKVVERVRGRVVEVWAVERLGKLPAGSEARVKLEGLSARELEVFWLEMDGLTPGQMADRLGISRKTVAVHAYNLRVKLGVANRMELWRLGVRWGLVG